MGTGTRDGGIDIRSEAADLPDRVKRVYGGPQGACDTPFTGVGSMHRAMGEAQVETVIQRHSWLRGKGDWG